VAKARELVLLLVLGAVISCRAEDNRHVDPNVSPAEDPSPAAGDRSPIIAIEVGKGQPPDSTVNWDVNVPANIRCSPDTIRPGDTLTVRMDEPHGRYFIARGPDGTDFFIVFPGEGRPDRTQRRVLLPTDSFRKVTLLKLNTRTLTAGPWVFGRDTNEIVFRQAGVYRLMVGSEMETDGPQFTECRVTYLPPPAQMEDVLGDWERRESTLPPINLVLSREGTGLAARLRLSGVDLSGRAELHGTKLTFEFPGRTEQPLGELVAKGELQFRLGPRTDLYTLRKRP
jgi:hypothetical protein